MKNALKRVIPLQNTSSQQLGETCSSPRLGGVLSRNIEMIL
jgi:hypothetical protein